MKTDTVIRRKLFVLIAISCLVRMFFAFFIELTNDEVNYWTYALYPSLSYFDHPPMVGWLIRLSTLNLLFTNELFVRLSSILIGAINTYVIFLIGRYVKDELTGFYSAILYQSSIYCFIISGIFIMPDTPLLLFWLLSVYYFMKSVMNKNIDRSSRISLILAGMFVGLALLSKYHSVYLWVGALLYVIIFNRKWFKTKEIYISLLISIVIFIPVIIWNYNNDFISFTFQSERVDIMSSGIRFDYLLTELVGEIFYNNPVNVVLIIIALFSIKRMDIDKDKKWFILLFSLPLILTFICFSLFRRTLPHWTGPGYIALIILTAAFYSQKQSVKRFFKVPLPHLVSQFVLLAVLISGYLQINGLLFRTSTISSNPTELGRNDVTLDMFGWKQIAKRFSELNEKYVIENIVKSDVPIISNKWYNAGHIDYYLGRFMDKRVYCAGYMNDMRNYLFVNRVRGDMNMGDDAIYISPSRDYKNSQELLKSSFEKIIPLDTIRVRREGEVVENVFLYKLEKYTGKMFY